MERNEAVKLLESEGFKIIELLEENDGDFAFLCDGDDQSEIEVAVVNGMVVISPT